jgi:hypothetical protein
MMSQLADTKKCPAKLVVAKGCSLVALFGLADSDFQLVFCSRVSNYLPVMDAFVVADGAENSSEKVVVFFEIEAPPGSTDGQHTGPLGIDLPYKAGYQNTHDFTL